MNAHDFVRELAATAPSIDALRSIGLSTSEAEVFRSASICRRKKGPYPLKTSNELLTLAGEWDVGKVEIGMVRLLGTPLVSATATRIGLLESDPIVIDNATSEMFVQDATVSGHIIWRIAISPGAFLDAMLTAAMFLSSRSVGQIEFDNLDTAKVTAQDCSRLAGGDVYSAFYSMLLGAE